MAGGITVCDVERNYALRLTEYLYENGDFPCEIRVCTEPARLREVSPPEETAVLVISRTAWGQFRQGGEGEDRSYSRILALEEEEAYPPEEEYLQAGKYQPAPVILDLVRQAYLESGPVLPGRAGTLKPLRISGIYAPAGGCLRTTVALALGRVLAEQGRTLYITTEPCSGLGERLGIEFRGSLSDLIYFSECSQDRFPAQVRLFARTTGQLDLLPPMRSWMELRSVTGEEWLRFLDTLAGRTGYEELVIDLTEHVDGFLDLLRRCDRLWIPDSGDSAAGAKLQFFRGILQACGAEEVWDRAVQLALPPADRLQDRDYTEYGENSGGGQEEWIIPWIRERLSEETGAKRF